MFNYDIDSSSISDDLIHIVESKRQKVDFIFDEVPEKLKQFIQQQYPILTEFETCARLKYNGQMFVFDDVSKKCPYAQRVHNSNHTYFKIDTTGNVSWCCHDTDCKKNYENNQLVFELFKKKLQDDLLVELKREADEVMSTKEFQIEKEKENIDVQMIETATTEANETTKELGEGILMVPQRKDGGILDEQDLFVGTKTKLFCWNCGKKGLIPLVNPTRQVYLKCDGCGKTTPRGEDVYLPISQDRKALQSLFRAWNNVQMINNGTVNIGDVSSIFGTTPVTAFEDENLNALMFEALADNSYAYANLLYYFSNNQFNVVNKEWYFFDNHHWNQDCESAVILYIAEKLAPQFRTLRKFYEDHTTDRDLSRKQSKHIQSIIEKMCKTSGANDIINYCVNYFTERDLRKPRELQFHIHLDTNKSLLCFENGIYDLDSGVFRDGDPSDMCTLSTGYKFNPISEPEKRTFLNSFFEDIEPNSDDRNYLLLFLGSMLKGENKEEAFHIFTGGAGNGKSLLTTLLQHALGSYVCAVDPKIFTQITNGSSPKPEFIHMKGRRGVFISEPSAKLTFCSDLIKMFIGKDKIVTRTLFSKVMVEFIAEFCFVSLCNDIPLFDKYDKGIERRLRVLSFPTKFVENPTQTNERQININLKSIIGSYRNELMLMLIEYYQKYSGLENGLQQTPTMIKNAMKQQEENNNVLKFFNECTEHYDEDNLLFSELYPIYVKWMGSSSRPLGRNKFINELKNLAAWKDNIYNKKSGKGPQGGVQKRRFIQNVIAQYVEEK